MFLATACRGALDDALDQSRTGAERSRVLIAAHAEAERLVDHLHRVTLTTVTAATAEEHLTVTDCAEHLNVSHRRLRYWLAHPPADTPPVTTPAPPDAVLSAAAVSRELDQALAAADGHAARLRILGNYRTQADAVVELLQQRIDDAAIDRIREGIHPGKLTTELGLAPNRIRVLRKAARA
jgi:hypothetical protein